MSLPGVTLNVLDGNLGLQQGSNEQTQLIMGVCTAGTPNTMYSIGDQSTLTSSLELGPLAEAVAYALQVGGGPVLAIPTIPTNVGAAGSVTHTGSGGTLAVTLAPHKAIVISCTTGGTLGTAQFTFALGSGSASAPVTSAAGWSSTGYRVPGVMTTLTFTSGTYATDDVYTVSTAGTVTHTAGTGPAVPTQASSPVDNYSALVTISKSGALGTAQFTYSLDNGETALAGNGSTSSAIITAGSGIYAIPNSGIVITFTGSQVLGDTFNFKTGAASTSNNDLVTAYGLMETTLLASQQEAMVTVVNMPVSAAGWGTEAGSQETAALALFNLGVFVRFISEVPTVGSIFVLSGTLTVDSADTDSVLIAERALVSAAHVVAGAGDCLLLSPLTGLAQRRSAAWTASARASAVEASRNIGDVSLGGLPGVIHLFRDENASPGLDAAGYTTMRTFPGLPGFYITDAHTCSSTTSDYYPFTNARVIDLGCHIALINALPLVNGKVPTTVRNGLVGVITEKKAQQIEARLDNALLTGLVNIEPQDAVDASTTVNRTHNILSDGNLIIAVGIQPFAYSHTVTVNIGLTVSA